MKMTFRQTGLCRLIILVLTLCMLTGAVSTALSEAEMTEEQLDEIWLHLQSKGHKPYKYESAEVEKVKFYIAQKPGAQQFIEKA